MKKINTISIILTVALLLLLFKVDAASESKQWPKEQQEMRILFDVPIEPDIDSITRYISIEKIVGNKVYARLSKRQWNVFKNWDIPFIEIQNPTLFKTSSIQIAGKYKWGHYPSYHQYDSLMRNFELKYPKLCHLNSIGKSIHGKDIFMLSITAPEVLAHSKPEVLYSSTIHGDEVLGYYLMLHLIDSLLQGYGNNPTITKLMDSLTIWINPLANPDGTYNRTDDNIFSAIRENADTIDLNRNFPDPHTGNHPDDNAWQPENIAMMGFLNSHHIVISANFHTGSEVVNYPWDAPWTPEVFHPDNNWFASIAGQYVDSARFYAGKAYFSGTSSTGYIIGYNWYPIYGGRQDYVTYFLHGRETTIELYNNDNKITPESELELYWKFNCPSLINYLGQAMYGIHGKVVDNSTGLPVKAKIEVLNHDTLNSWVFSDSTNGQFVRLIYPGNYALKVSSSLYFDTTISNIAVTKGRASYLGISLRRDPSKTKINSPVSIPFSLSPNPCYEYIIAGLPSTSPEIYTIRIIDATGRTISAYTSQANGNEIKINTSKLAKGIYFIVINNVQKFFSGEFIKQ